MNKSQVPAPQKDILSLLLDDHRSVKKIFKDFESAKDVAVKQNMVKQACDELTIHTQVEEQEFYPFLRDQDAKAFGDILNEALVEHASAKDLIKQLSGMSPKDDLYDAKFIVLGEYVAHHVTEEEEQLFPKIISKKIDLRPLVEPIQALREGALFGKK